MNYSYSLAFRIERTRHNISIILAINLEIIELTKEPVKLSTAADGVKAAFVILTVLVLRFLKYPPPNVLP